MGLPGIEIAGVVSCLPDNLVLNDDFDGQYTEKTIRQISKSIGVDSRYRAKNSCSTYDLCIHAASALIDKLGWDKSSIDGLILMTQTSSQQLPGDACKIHGSLGLPSTSFAFDINLGCSGYIYGLWNIMSLMEKCRMQKGLLLVGDTISKTISNKDEAFYKNCYLYPAPCMFGFIASKYISAATDISDGFYGDLNKILNNKVGASLIKKDFLISNNLKNIISTNKSKISIEDILSWGDDYQLVFTANKNFKNKINNLGKKNNIKLTNIGTIIKAKGIYDDSMNVIKNLSSYDHFS